MAMEFFSSTKDCSAKDKTIWGNLTFQAKFAPEVELNQKYTKGLGLITGKILFPFSVKSQITTAFTALEHWFC